MSEFRRRLMMAAAQGGWGLPYDAEIEYLQSDGNQYIDTGIYGNQDSKLEIKFMFPSTSGISASGRVFGSRYSNSSRLFCIGTNIGTISTSANLCLCYGSQVITTVNVSIGTWFIAVLDKDVHTINGSQYGSPITQTFTTPGNLKLFAFDNNGTLGYGRLRCEYCKIWSGGALVRDFIPVRVGTTGYMYDRVSGQLFGNSGTGDFILGNDIT